MYRWKWAAIALLLPVFALELTELTGVTHLLPGPDETGNPPTGNPRHELIPIAPADKKGPPRPVALPKYGDLEYTNSLGMKFKLIKAGKFTMGSSQQEIDGCLKQYETIFHNRRIARLIAPRVEIGDFESETMPIRSEGPEHPVEITQPFYMGATEVTVGHFRQLVAANQRYRQLLADSDKDLKYIWNSKGREKYPVNVSWKHAVLFCEWLSAKEGKSYRLPTEAEWEYCCRAGKTGRRYCFGDDEGQLKDYAWYHGNSTGFFPGDIGAVRPVAKRKPNAWGLCDMHGNLAEWCQDRYDPNYYENSPVKDPPGPAGPLDPNPPHNELHVVRGGCLFFNCRCASRMCSNVTVGHRNGFRVVLVFAPPGGARP